jgi:hypothetical protein
LRRSRPRTKSRANRTNASAGNRCNVIDAEAGRDELTDALGLLGFRASPEKLSDWRPRNRSRSCA